MPEVDPASGSAAKQPREIVTLTTNIEVFSSIEDLPEDEQELLRSARDAMSTAHVPYSHFTVGAALRLGDGSLIAASNVENASYGLTICAERSALVMANALGRKRDIKKIAVMGTGENFDNTEPVTLCGACRQVINEFEQLSPVPFTILMTGKEGKSDIWRIKGIESFLAKGFGPRDLNLV